MSSKVIHNKIKIIFIGTSEFAVPILEKLINSDNRPKLVITQPDKRVGRKQELQASPLKKAALEYKIPVLQPEKVSTLKPQLSSLNPDLIIVAAYGQIIPKEILYIPKRGTLNVHPSLLPCYRGASPIQTAILNGDKETGVTIMLMDEKMDHGPILAAVNLSIADKITAPELEKELANLGAELLIKALPDWMSGKIKPKPQDHSMASFTKILEREDGNIVWAKSAEQIERQIRAFTPWPGAFTIWQNKRLKIIEAGLGPKNPKKTPGKAFLTNKKELAVICGQTSLVLKKIQLEGGKVLDGQTFLRGHQDIIGDILK